jgi:AcrR family transcriptional regulator
MTPEPAPARLPRGRHGLSREEVVESQRARLLRAMADAVADKGYAATSVADVIARAGVSRETFYEQFSSKEDCFLDTYDKAGAILLTRIAGTQGEEGTPQDATPDERFAGLLRAYLTALEAEPSYARTFLVEVHAAGPEALRRRMAMQQRFTDALVELFDARAAHERFACELLVAALGAMVTTRIALGEGASLHELEKPIVDLVRRRPA